MGDVAGDQDTQEAVENYVLLCHWCHKEDPEPKTRQEHLDWLSAYRIQQKESLDKLYEYGKTISIEEYDTDPIVFALMKQVMPNYPRKNDLLRERLMAAREAAHVA